MDFLGGSLKARNLWRKSLIKIWPTARNISSEFRRNLYGWFGLRERKKSLGEIFYEMLLTQEIIYHSASTNIIFKENPDQNALEYLAFGENFIMDRLTARIFGAVRAENKSKNLFFAESRQK